VPRAEVDSSCGGLRVPGLYEALRERECGHHERRGGRRFYADPEDHSKGFSLRDRRLFDALKAGEPVVVRGHDLGGWGVPTVPLSAEQKDWPNWYTVTPGDRIEPADSPVVDPIRPPAEGVGEPPSHSKSMT
jgi:hypothetical protein